MQLKNTPQILGDTVNKQLLDTIVAISQNVSAYDDDLQETWDNVIEQVNITINLLNEYLDQQKD